MNPRMARGEAKPNKETAGNGNGSAEHLLALRGFSKSFGPVRALHEVDFEVDSGEIVALVGDNGAGKSTLIKAIDGVQPPDRGEAYFEGKRIRISDPQTAERLGIATVFQDLALCDNLDVVANLFLGKELVDGVPVHVDRNAMEAGAVFVVNRVKPHTSFRGPVESGLAKMCAVGLGKQPGARLLHSRGSAGLRQLVPAAARLLAERGLLIGGLAIVENQRDQTAMLRGLTAPVMKTANDCASAIRTVDGRSVIDQ